MRWRELAGEHLLECADCAAERERAECYCAFAQRGLRRNFVARGVGKALDWAVGGCVKVCGGVGGDVEGGGVR